MEVFINEDETVDKAEEPPPPPPKKRLYRKVKRKQEPDYSTFNFPGCVKLFLTDEAQKSISCVSGIDVVAEVPWIYVEKQAILNDIERYKKGSEFWKIKDKVNSLDQPKILIIYLADDSREEDEYSFCLTTEAEEKANEMISKLKTERDERVKSAIHKCAKPWKSWGSAPEVSDLFNKNNRPLLEMEVESRYPFRKATSKFKLRLAEDTRDGYVEILCLRTTYINVFRLKIDFGVQATCTVVTIGTQTSTNNPTNAITQYDYSYKHPQETKQFTRNLKLFAANKMHIFDDSIYVNGYIDFYVSDYNLLAKQQLKVRRPQVAKLVEHFSFYNHTLPKDKVISAVSWHPMWTGIVAISYANQAHGVYRKHKSKVDEVLQATFDITPVLLWSFVDSLVPRLVLETSRDVTALSFCPYDENILVGGCVNGQVFVWDLTNKLKKVEEVEILTEEQKIYRIKMHSMISWMKNIYDPRFVRITVASQLELSPSAAITNISWISPFKKFDKAGKASQISENTPSLQFSTTSLDGTVQIWDLGVKSTASGPAGRKKSKRLKVRPAALTADISRLKPLHRVFKPTFRVNVVVPHTNRLLPLALARLRRPCTIYTEKYPNPNHTSDFTDRRYFTPDLRDSKHFENHFMLGSAEGDILHISWEGYDYGTNIPVNKENATIKCINKIHDGPVVCIAESHLFDDLILTVGGRVFALWLLSFPEKPIIWRKSKQRYTHGNWSNIRYSCFRLCRSDGYTEVWNLTIRSDCFQAETQRSGKSIFGAYSHSLPLKRRIVGLSDYTGSFKLYFVDKVAEEGDSEPYQLYNLLMKEADKKNTIQKWIEYWDTKNPEIVASHRANLPVKEKIKQEEKKVQTGEEPQTLIPSKPAEFMTEDAKWQAKEVLRMNAILLGKKGVEISELEQQQIPLLHRNKEKVAKDVKLRTALGNSSKKFEEAVNKYFADAVEQEPPPPPDPYKGGDYVNNKNVYFDCYINIAEKYLKFVKDNKYKHRFNWIDMIKSGKERRTLLDSKYNQYTHKDRIKNFKMRANQNVPKVMSHSTDASDSLDED